MSEHLLRLHAEPFAQIVAGTKIIESRLYDEKRQQIQLGDSIIFVHRTDPQQTVRVRVVGLLRYATFADMFAHNDAATFGGDSSAALTAQIGQFYTAQDQKQYGVLGIEFVLLPAA